MKDLHNNLKVSTALAPVAIDSDTTTEGEVIDTQGFDSLEFVIQAGVLTDGIFTAALAESDSVDESGDLVDEGVVAESDVLGSLQSLQNDDGDESGLAKRFGYCGGKRYVRLDIVSTETDDGGLIGALAVQSSARNAPVA